MWHVHIDLTAFAKGFSSISDSRVVPMSQVGQVRVFVGSDIDRHDVQARDASHLSKPPTLPESIGALRRARIRLFLWWSSHISMRPTLNSSNTFFIFLIPVILPPTTWSSPISFQNSTISCTCASITDIFEPLFFY